MPEAQTQQLNPSITKCRQLLQAEVASSVWAGFAMWPEKARARRRRHGAAGTFPSFPVLVPKPDTSTKFILQPFNIYIQGPS